MCQYQALDVSTLLRHSPEVSDDALVYELYGLTEEEIAIVEGPDH